ncbi:hypothetical protein PV08_08204 [Exophiala spinifera]|uniref:Uncharacterized protein n=1 Tax=Exophiala spinifera TaxID=91928 RepID=A0A0D1ZJQ0_9EURO|nr:uncharacterized protein PV08_08204 [Exophiala spinifera]KIW13017.1 hypothetical protein PV08_08204 [Exophiala spinifera]
MSDQTPERATSRQRGLKDVIDDSSFWTVSDRELLSLIKAEFPLELQRLHRATFVRDSDAPSPDGPSISETLYGHDYPEVNRTLLGILALRWLWNDEYGAFVGTQPSPVRLARESFNWLRQIYITGLKSAEEIYTLITCMVINDLGKDPNLATEYAAKEGLDVSNVNHDMILYRAVEAGMIEALDRLAENYKQDVLLGIKLGSSFNFGQLAQAENAPASLTGLAEMRDHDRAFELRYMEQVLDLAGASGHEDWTCAKKMVEPVFESYRTVYDVAGAIIAGDTSFRDAYDIVLIRKAELLHRLGYQRVFDVKDNRDRAVMRLFCLANTSNVRDAEMYFESFTERISEDTRQMLISGLNVDGTIESPAVQATYIPAMLTRAASRTLNGTEEEKIKVIGAMLRYLARCLKVDKSSLSQMPKGVTVIERDVRKIIPVLDSEEFKKNPDILDREEIPSAQVANIAPDIDIGD